MIRDSRRNGQRIVDDELHPPGDCNCGAKATISLDLSATANRKIVSGEASDKRIHDMKSESRPMVYLGDYVALTRTVFGHSIYVDTRDISLAPHILLHGFWEMWITNLFLRLIKPGMTVVDIGANIGYYSLLAAAHTGPNGKVIAFEPNPGVFRLMANSMEVNGFLGRSELVCKGVMDRTGDLTFHCLAYHHGASGFFINPEVVTKYRDHSESMSVPCTSLDDYFADRDERIDLIKIDAEGGEPSVIAGATRILTSNPQVKILMEYTSPSRPAFDALVQLGFEARTVAHDSSLRSIAPEELERSTDWVMLYFTRT